MLKIIIAAAVVLFLLIVGFVAVLFFGVRHVLKSSEANVAAVAVLSKSHVAREQLGNIVEIGTPMGSISTEGGGSGQATLSMSVTGTRSKATYYATVNRVNGQWIVASGRLELPDGRSVVLDIPNNPGTPAPPSS